LIIVTFQRVVPKRCLQGGLHVVDPLLAYLECLNRLLNNVQQIVDIRLLLVTQGIGVLFKGAVGFPKSGLCHGLSCLGVAAVRPSWNSICSSGAFAAWLALVMVLPAGLRTTAKPRASVFWVPWPTISRQRDSDRLVASATVCAARLRTSRNCSTT